MKLALVAFLTALTGLAAAVHPSNACILHSLAAIPTQPDRYMALVKVGINGKPADMLIDTGASYTALWRDRAVPLGVKLGNVVGMDVYGVSGRSAVQVGYIDAFDFGGAIAHHMAVTVVGSNSVDPATAGYLGLDFLSQSDLDFDLADHRITLMKDEGCTDPQMVYWNKPYSQAAIRGGAEIDGYVGSFQVTAMLNGQPVDAAIDSGSAVTIVDASLAARLGATPIANSGGKMQGIGYKQLPIEAARFDTFTLGDETIRNAVIRTAPLFSNVHIDETGTRLGAHFIANEAPRMLIGIDFLRAHRMLISPSRGKLYFSYLGGPVFDVTRPRDEPPH